jgi:hypothetical protein
MVIITDGGEAVCERLVSFASIDWRPCPSKQKKICFRAKKLFFSRIFSFFSIALLKTCGILKRAIGTHVSSAY